MAQRRTEATSRPALAPRREPDLDAEGLAAALRRTIRGEVRFRDGDRHLYSTDASNFRQLPIGVVLPRDADDIVQTHKLCREFGAPLTNRGGGTSMAGQATNVAVVLDTSKYLRDVLEVNVDDKWARVQPGCVLDSLQAKLYRHNLRFGPDPATHNRTTLGGMIGNNACGIHSIRGGRTSDNVLELDVLTYDGVRLTVGPTSEEELNGIVQRGGRRGQIYACLRALRDRYHDRIRERFPDIPRRVSGYNLDELLPDKGFHLARALTGTEGTCATVLEAKLRAMDVPPAKSLLVVGYPSIFEAADHLTQILEHEPIGLEGIDGQLIANLGRKGLRASDLPLLPKGEAFLLCEFAGDNRAEANAKGRTVMRELDVPDENVSFFDDPDQAAHIWHTREAALGATAWVPGLPMTWPGWEDSAVAPDQLGRYLRDLQSLFEENDYRNVGLYGHFGDGCIHCRMPFDLRSAEGVARYRRFLDDAADLVISYGGSLSGEHGDGQQRAELLARMFGSELVDAFREFKSIWDPDGKMNPGKVVDPYRADQNLRLGADYRPWQAHTKFSYRDSNYSWAQAQLRCVGIGTCRRDDGHGTMCPSYMVTHEEMHSTRGRARLLHEMTRPDSQLNGWRDEHVREALELCLSCKGCTADCPVTVDIPTYKAEFYYHHYRRRLRPRAHYALGLINVWSKFASYLPGIANFSLHAPGLGASLKKAAGVAPQRPAPRYAAETFREWFLRRPVHYTDRPRVLLFPDTFTDYFQPEVGQATVAVLEHAGFQVTVPERQFCCGRPLYDYGMLDLAEAYLSRLVDVLRSDVSAGVKIVGVEPSCVAVFRDELLEMKPHDADALRIADNTHTLAEFLTEVADYAFPTLQRTAIVHGHCHHKGVMGLDADQQALRALGLDWEELDAGCCGLAGSFGFEAGRKYELSIRAGERKLLPAVRDAEDATLIIADGFSCRSQIEHLQERRSALHLAQVIDMAIRAGPSGPGHGPVENDYLAGDPSATWTAKDTRVAVAASALAGLFGGLTYLRRRSPR